MAYTTINKSSSYFNTVIYTGDGTTPRTLTGVGFKPDFSWIKRRDGGQGNTNHNLWNNISGAGNNAELSSNITGEEGGSSADLYGYISAFTSDGFTVADGTNATYKNLYTNNSGGTYVAWNWLANNTSGSSNTNGSITSTVAANTTAGFSIVSYTGTGATATVGHGLGSTPKMIIFKKRSGADNWVVYHVSVGNTAYLLLDQTSGSASSSGMFNNTSPTSSVFTVSTAGPNNGSGATFIAYCFAEIKGYSKFGSYTGNGSADGPFVYTGFKPSWVLLKDTTTGGSGWEILDNKRNTYNVMGERLYPNSSDVGSTATLIDFLSNGFKLRTSTDTWINTSGNTYIYAAFAENPFVTSGGIPVTAR